LANNEVKQSRRNAIALVVGAAALILIATLYPSGQSGSGAAPRCVICGDRGIADALVNVLLFMPFGAAIAGVGWSALHAAIAGLTLSGLIESAQLNFIPGRDASLGDLLFNSAGSILGAVGIRTFHVLMSTSSAAAARLSLGAALLAAATIAATGWLLQVSPTKSDDYFVMWTPTLAHLAHYDGKVHSTRIGDLSLTPGRAANTEVLADRIREGSLIVVIATAGTRVPKLAALLAIYDREQREVLLIGPSEDQLVFRYRARAAELRLDYPDLRVANAMAPVQTGDPMTVRFDRVGATYCLGLGEAPLCTLGFTAGSGWSLLMYGEYWPDWVKKSLNFAWLLLLAFPVGLWLRKRPNSAFALLVLAASLIALPRHIGLLATPVVAYFAAAIGISSGVLCARHFSSRFVARARL
jgi:hypothetical protein